MKNTAGRKIREFLAAILGSLALLIVFACAPEKSPLHESAPTVESITADHKVISEKLGFVHKDTDESKALAEAIESGSIELGKIGTTYNAKMTVKLKDAAKILPKEMAEETELVINIEGMGIQAVEAKGISTPDPTSNNKNAFTTKFEDYVSVQVACEKPDCVKVLGVLRIQYQDKGEDGKVKEIVRTLPFGFDTPGGQADAFLIPEAKKE